MIFLDTTGVEVRIDDLGIVIPHPTTDFEITDQFTADEIQESTDLTNAIHAGTLNWKKTSGGVVETNADYDPDQVEIEELASGEAPIDSKQIKFDPTGTDFENLDPIPLTVYQALLSVKGLDFTSITEAEVYFEETEESTTSNNWVTAFQAETNAKSAGSFIVIHSGVIKQSSSNKVMGYRVQYRLNGTGTWLTFLDTTYSGRANAYFTYTSLGQVVTGEGDTIQVRFRYGQTDNGGTASIKNKGFILWKVAGV